jgi:hypothetical protein
MPIFSIIILLLVIYAIGIYLSLTASDIFSEYFTSRIIPRISLILTFIPIVNFIYGILIWGVFVFIGICKYMIPEVGDKIVNIWRK